MKLDMNKWMQFKIKTLLIAAVMLACSSLRSAQAQLSPAPDGDYPGGNTAEGSGALFRLNGGQNNTAMGADALEFNSTGNDNTATGTYALLANNASQNTATGSGALQLNGGDNNTATGFRALNQNDTGTLNTATGVDALSSNIKGSNNTASGFQALLSNTSGPVNTATGAYALYSNTTGQSNVATGVDTLYHNQAGHDNTADGYLALLNSTGSNNTALGSNAGASLTNGNNNIDIGANVLGKAGESAKIRIGKQGTQNGTFIAGIYNIAEPATTSVIKPVYINSNGQLGTAPPASSARFKEAIKPMDKSSEAVLKLKPVTFRYKNDEEATPQFGLIAEEVAKANPDLVVRDENGEIYTVRYEAVNAMLLNEFLKEHRKMEEQQTTIDRQQKQIDALTSTVQKVSDKLELNEAGRSAVAGR